MIKNIIPYIVVFFYLYPVPFIFLPVSTRVLFGVFGFLILATEILQYKIKLKLNKRLVYFLVLLLLIPFVALISIGINQTSDIEFIKYPISMLTILFASYFVAKILNNYYQKLDFQNVSLLMINIILIQAIIAFTMFLIPELRDFLLGIQRLSAENIEKMSDLFEFRVIGFGTMFFDAGVISGFGLILIGLILRFYQLTSKQVVTISIKFLFILIVGMMMARTTLIGGLLGLMLIFMPKNLKATISMVRKRFLFILNIVVIPIILMMILFFLVPKIGEIFEPLFNFAFEIFINYFEKGSAESASTNQLKNMYIFPENIKTWIIGDGLWMAIDGSGYYMHTDVGYLRLIYYFGVIGLLIYFMTEFYLLKITFRNYRFNIHIYGMIFLYLLILNLKGYTVFLSLILIYYSTSIINKKVL